MQPKSFTLLKIQKRNFEHSHLDSKHPKPSTSTDPGTILTISNDDNNDDDDDENDNEYESESRIIYDDLSSNVSLCESNLSDLE